MYRSLSLAIYLLIIGASALPSNDSPKVRQIDSSRIEFEGKIYVLESSSSSNTAVGEPCTPESGLTPADGTPFYIFLGCTCGCIFTAALAAGLTMSYLSVDKLQLEIYCSHDAIDWSDESQWPRGIERKEALEMKSEQAYAKMIYPLVAPHSEMNKDSCWSNEPHHLLMVTLLLMNSAANEALPIFLDKLVPSPIIAILVSVTVVLIVGEILPTAVFTGSHQP